MAKSMRCGHTHTHTHTTCSCIHAAPLTLPLQYASALSQSLRAKSLKVFEEIALRHLSNAAVHLGRLDEAEELFRRAESRGLVVNERSLVSMTAARRIGVGYSANFSSDLCDTEAA